MPSLLTNLRINRVAAVDKGAGDGVRVVFWKRDTAAIEKGGPGSGPHPGAGGHAAHGPHMATGRTSPGGSRHEIQMAGGKHEWGKPTGNTSPGGSRAEYHMDSGKKIWAVRKDLADDAAAQAAQINQSISNDQSQQQLGRMTPQQDTQTKINEPGNGGGNPNHGKDGRFTTGKRDEFVAKHLDAISAAVVAEVKKSGAVDFNEADAQQELAECVRDLMNEVREAVGALDRSICSISYDDDVADKAAMIAESFDQFRAHVAGLGLDDDVTKSLASDIGAAHPLLKGDRDMDTAAIQKMIDEAVTKSTKPLTDTIAKQAGEIAILKMSEKHKDFHDKMSGDAKDKFAAMSPGERDDHMDKNPVKKGVDALPADVRGVVEPIIKSMGETVQKNVELSKQVHTLTDERDRVEFGKRAVGLGLPEAHGEIMRKAYAGDVAAIGEHEKALKGLVARAAAGERILFSEIGKSEQGGTGATAYDQIMVKAKEFKKADPKLTEAQAFTKAYTDPANRELAETHKREEFTKRRSVAA